MILDKIDINILKRFYELKEGETQEIWKWIGDSFPNAKTKHEKTAKYNLIISRIKRMKDFFKINENGDKNYVLVESKILFLMDYISEKKIKNCLIEYLDGELKVYKMLKTF